MNQARDDLFARAGLALKQYGGISRGNFGNKGAYVLDGVANTHQALIEVFKVALSCGVLGRHGFVSLFLD
jgi:hypothetical protein